MLSDKKILLIHYYFPPIPSIGALRNYYFSQQAHQYFESVYILTTTNARNYSKKGLKSSGDKIFQIPTLDYRSIALLRKEKVHFSEAKKTRPIVQLLIKLLHSFPFNLIVGEGGLLYIILGPIRALKLVREKGITHIYSSYSPYADHFIAYCIKRRYPTLFWIADFRDLHQDPIRNNTVFPKLQYWFNQQIIKRANIVTTVSEGLAQNLKSFNQNVYVLRNGISNDQLTDRSNYAKGEYFTISYTGSIYAGLQSPHILLKVLKKLVEERKIDAQKLKFIYAGKDSTSWQAWIEKYSLTQIFEDKGIVAFKESLQIQRQSSINLLLTWSRPNYYGILTGKLYEYLAAQSPILAIADGYKDPELDKILDELNAGLLVTNEKKYEIVVRKLILENYEYWLQRSRINKTTNLARLKEFTWEENGRKFFSNLLNGKGLDTSFQE